jgi:hypothetical protein
MKAAKRDLVGRKIVDVEFRRFHDPDHGWCTDPVLILDNGRRVYFVTQETVTGDYGVFLGITEKLNRTTEDNYD